MAVSVKFNTKLKKVKISPSKSRLNDDFADKIWFKKSFWDIDVIERRELIDSMNLTEEEKLILNDITFDVEELAVDYLNRDEKGIIPYLGTFKLHGGIRNIAKHSEEIKAAKRAGKSNEELKELQLKLYIDGVNKDKEKEEENKRLRYLKKIFKKKYNEYYQTLGKSYAEMFIWTISLIKPIEFDEEYQKIYEKLNNI